VPEAERSAPSQRGWRELGRIAQDGSDPTTAKSRQGAAFPSQRDDGTQRESGTGEGERGGGSYGKRGRKRERERERERARARERERERKRKRNLRQM